MQRRVQPERGGHDGVDVLPLEQPLEAAEQLDTLPRFPEDRVTDDSCQTAPCKNILETQG